MDTTINLEHIKSLKEFSRGNMMFFGWSVSRWSTEDPDIFLVRFGTREGLISYIVVVGKKRFAFGIEGDLARSLKGYESDQLMNIWIDQMAQTNYRNLDFPSSIVQKAVWMYVRFNLSLRDVEELLAELGIKVSYETIRRWVARFGPLMAKRMRQTRSAPHPQWPTKCTSPSVGVGRICGADYSKAKVLLPKQSSRINGKPMPQHSAS